MTTDPSGVAGGILERSGQWNDHCCHRSVAGCAARSFSTCTRGFEANWGSLQHPPSPQLPRSFIPSRPKGITRESALRFGSTTQRQDRGRRSEERKQRGTVPVSRNSAHSVHLLERSDRIGKRGRKAAGEGGLHLLPQPVCWSRVAYSHGSH